jgi:hypothetical protein
MLFCFSRPDSKKCGHFLVHGAFQVSAHQKPCLPVDPKTIEGHETAFNIFSVLVFYWKIVDELETGPQKLRELQCTDFLSGEMCT